MPKTTKAKAADPFADMRNSFADAAAANQAQAFEFASTKLANAQDAATEQVEKVQAAVQANVDAALAAGQALYAGAEKIGAHVQNEFTVRADARIAAAQKAVEAKSLQDLFMIQSALVEAEQESVRAFFDTMANLTQTVANDAMKPVQDRFNEGLKAFNMPAA